jgi:toxin FitB
VNFLLDTNVVSEWAKPRPNPDVVRWLADVDEDRVFLSVVTLAELRYGVEKLPAGARRTRLDAWLRGELRERFEGRILAVDEAVAEQMGDDRRAP